MREKYLSLSLESLKEIAKARGLKGISTLKKSELVERMVQEDEKERQEKEINSNEQNQETRQGNGEIRSSSRKITVQSVLLWNSQNWTAESV